MDLLSEAITAPVNEGAVMQVKHPTTGEVLMDNGEPVTIKLLGTDSDAFQRVNNQAINRRLKTPRSIMPTAEEQQAIATEMLVACTLEWKGIGDAEGKPLLFTQANCKMLYTKARWLREQVDTFIGDRSNFMKQPSAS